MPSVPYCHMCSRKPASLHQGSASRAPPPLQVLNPATAEPIATVPQCGGAETRAAISAAAASFDSWAGWPGKERAKLLRK